jgi:hypothetical protein
MGHTLEEVRQFWVPYAQQVKKAVGSRLLQIAWYTGGWPPVGDTEFMKTYACDRSINDIAGTGDAEQPYDWCIKCATDYDMITGMCSDWKIILEGKKEEIEKDLGACFKELLKAKKTFYAIVPDQFTQLNDLEFTARTSKKVGKYPT